VPGPSQPSPFPSAGTDGWIDERKACRDLPWLPMRERHNKTDKTYREREREMFFFSDKRQREREMLWAQLGEDKTREKPAVWSYPAETAAVLVQPPSHLLTCLDACIHHLPPWTCPVSYYTERNRERRERRQISKPASYKAPLLITALKCYGLCVPTPRWQA